jgi:hypothetical protein
LERDRNFSSPPVPGPVTFLIGTGSLSTTQSLGTGMQKSQRKHWSCPTIKPANIVRFHQEMGLDITDKLVKMVTKPLDKLTTFDIRVWNKKQYPTPTILSIT